MLLLSTPSASSFLFVTNCGEFNTKQIRACACALKYTRSVNPSAQRNMQRLSKRLSQSRPCCTTSTNPCLFRPVDVAVLHEVCPDRGPRFVLFHPKVFGHFCTECLVGGCPELYLLQVRNWEERDLDRFASPVAQTKPKRQRVIENVLASCFHPESCLERSSLFDVWSFRAAHSPLAVHCSLARHDIVGHYRSCMDSQHSCGVGFVGFTITDVVTATSEKEKNKSFSRSYNCTQRFPSLLCLVCKLTMHRIQRVCGKNQQQYSSSIAPGFEERAGSLL